MNFKNIIKKTLFAFMVLTIITMNFIWRAKADPTPPYTGNPCAPVYGAQENDRDQNYLSETCYSCVKGNTPKGEYREGGVLKGYVYPQSSVGTSVLKITCKSTWAYNTFCQPMAVSPANTSPQSCPDIIVLGTSTGTGTGTGTGTNP